MAGFRDVTPDEVGGAPKPDLSSVTSAATDTASRTAGLAARGAAPVLAGAAAGGLVGSAFGPVGTGVGAIGGGVALPVVDALLWAARKTGAIGPGRSASDVVGGWLTELGLPEPQNLTERSIVAGGSAIGGVGATVAGAGRAAAHLAPGFMRTAADALRARPVAQTAVAAPAAATGQAVTETTGNPLLGVVAGTAVGGAGMVARPRHAVPSRADLQNAAHAAYDAADQAGVIVRGDAFENFVQGTTQGMRTEGYSARLHPKIAGVLAELEDAAATGRPQTLEELEILRRIAGSAARSNEPDEARLAQVVIDRIDDFVENLDPATLAAGDPAVAVPALQTARELWARNRKAEVIEQALERATNSSAQYSQSGMENAVRVQFRAIANNPKRMRQFNEREQELIRQVVRGGPVQNALRYFGKFAPTGPVSAMGGAGLGATVGGLLGGPPGAAIGGVLTTVPSTAARYAAGRIAAGNVQNLDESVRAGVPLPRWQLTPVLPARGAISALPSDDRKRRE